MREFEHPALQARAGSREARGRADEEDRRRQHRYDGADAADADQHEPGHDPRAAREPPRGDGPVGGLVHSVHTRYDGPGVAAFLWSMRVR